MVCLEVVVEPVSVAGFSFLTIFLSISRRRYIVKVSLKKHSISKEILKDNQNDQENPLVPHLHVLETQ